MFDNVLLDDIAKKLNIADSSIVEKQGNDYISINSDRSKQIPLKLDDVKKLLTDDAALSTLYIFEFCNILFEKSENNSIEINTRHLKFTNCEFENLCIKSSKINELKFVDCIFKENCILADCDINDIQLDNTQISGEFKLRLKPIQETNPIIRYFNCNKVEFHKQAKIQGNFDKQAKTQDKFNQINLCDTNFRGSLELHNIKVENDLFLSDLTLFQNLIIKDSEVNKLHFIGISFIDESYGFNNKQFKGFKIENSTFKETLSLANCILDKDFYLLNNIFQSNLHFDKADFRKELKFYQNTFEKEANFKGCNFSKNIYISNNVFKENAYFNNSIFYKYADFHECEFEKNTCFYGVTFEQTPNFSQVIFKDNLNLVNTNLNFDFVDLESKINSEHESYNKNKADNEKKSLEKFTNDFRDSFRNFKSVLLDKHNTLDALKFHKLELYCKEIELKQKWHKKGIEAKNETDMRKNTLKFKEVIDFCLLYFYRKFCDHHTDFLRVFNNLILLIALYISFFIIGKFELLIKNNDTNHTSTHIQINIDFINIIIAYIEPYKVYILYVYLIMLVGVAIWTFLIFIKQIPTIKLVAKTSYKPLFRDIVDIIIATLFILFVIAMADGYAPKGQFYPQDMCLFCFFIAFYLWLICMRTLFLRYIFICFAYILTLIGIGTSIALINPLIGKLVDDSIKITSTTLLSITFAYTILMALVLFSIQKTARKNSIVPS